MKINEKVKEAITTLDDYCTQHDKNCINEEGEQCPFVTYPSTGSTSPCSLLHRVPEHWRKDILKEEDGEFHVGDEVYGFCDTWIITSIDKNNSYACGINAKGEIRSNHIRYLKKTGRHFTNNVSNLFNMIGKIK